MLCPHCRTNIVIANEMTACPICLGEIENEVKHQLAAEECVRQVISHADKGKIETLLLENKRVEAMHLIRRIRGKTEAFVEARVLRIIEQTSTNDALINHVRETSNKENVKEIKAISLAPCAACNHLISPKAETCPHCGQPTGVHVCPKCQSSNTKVISGVSKATSIFLWGPFAANKVISKFECKDCGHNW